jgi:RecA/RadA recombinase
LKAKKAKAKDWRVMKTGEEEEVIPFNMLIFDHILKWSGLTRGGTVYQLHGDEGSAKSTTAYCINAEYQKFTQEPVAIFDFERTTHSWYLRNIGLDEDLAYIKKPDSVEDAVKDFIDFIDQGVRLFTFDSIPRMRSMVSQKDIKSGKAFDVQPGTHARIMQQFYDLVLPHIARVDGTLIMINQTRSRIEMSNDAKIAAKGYDTVTNLNYILPGGRANRYAISAMAELKNEKAYKPGATDDYVDEWVLEPKARSGEQYLAQRIRVRSLKNKVTGTGYRQGHMWLRPGLGLDENINTRYLAREFNLITNKGKRWAVGRSFDDAIKVFDNKADAIQALVIDEDEDLLRELKGVIIQKIQEDSGMFSIEVDEDSQRYLAGEENHSFDEEEVNTNLIPVEDDDLDAPVTSIS